MIGKQVRIINASSRFYNKVGTLIRINRGNFLGYVVRLQDGDETVGMRFTRAEFEVVTDEPDTQEVQL